MSQTNKDGLQIGKPVDFQTVSRLERERFLASIKPVSSADSPDRFKNTQRKQRNVTQQ